VTSPSSNRPSSAPIAGSETLLAPFLEACKPPERHRVGIEIESFGILTESRRPVPFEGPASVSAVLDGLRVRHRWSPVREQEAGPVIALTRDDASITLEPAAQLELSGTPVFSIHAVSAEVEQHRAALRDVSTPLGCTWIGLGFHPFARHEDLPRVPKLRYGVMERYLPTRGPGGLDMMRRTGTVQANLDYASEADAMRKLRVALAVQPVVTAMFANSPVAEGALAPERCRRGLAWLGMDPDRSGLLPFAWARDAGFEAYVQWALDAPMFVVRRGDEALDATALRFRDFLADGLRGHHATRSDWETHLNTLFPEVRLERTIEVRGADAQPPDVECALPALWKGLLYDAQALDGLEALADSLAYADVVRARPAIVADTLRARIGERPVQALAETLIDLARGGLARIAARDAHGNDERIFLDVLGRLVASGRSPGDVLRARLESGEDYATAVLSHGTRPVAERL
jgi:glutamate--cysteine ligase